jgi:bacteriorhodopsin
MAVIDLIYSRNDALHVNPQGGQSHLSEGPSDWLWAIMACFSLAFVRRPCESLRRKVSR